MNKIYDDMCNYGQTLSKSMILNLSHTSITPPVHTIFLPCRHQCGILLLYYHCLPACLYLHLSHYYVKPHSVTGSSSSDI